MNNLKELNMEELEQISGGDIFSACAFIGFSNDSSASACAVSGVGVQDEDIGVGAVACTFVGLGLGWTANKDQ